MADVFVSYSRRDADFVQRLARDLEARGKDVWVDVAGIRDGEVFPEALRRAIEGSDAFVFVISPDAVRSTFCEQEVAYAAELKKRIVPLALRKVPDHEIPEAIRVRNWIPFVENGVPLDGLDRLVAAIDTDLEWERQHTRLTVKALEWDAEGRDRSFLLRGSDLKAAEGWLASHPEGADPAPTQLQREYLLASREAAARRQRAVMGGAVAVAAVAIGLLIFALISRGQAVSERVAARAQALAAESQAQLPNDPEISLILGMRAVREKATPQTMFALRAALDASPLELALPSVPNQENCGFDSGLSATYSPDGHQIAEAGCDGALHLIDATSGRIIHAANLGVPLSAVAYSPDGSVLAVGTPSGAMLLDPRTGAVRARLTAIQGGTDGTGAVAFSPNGRLLAVDDVDGITLWSLPSLRPRTLEQDLVEGGTMTFTRNGRLLIVGGIDAAVHVYDVASGRLVHRIVAPGNQNTSWPEVVALSRDGSELAVGYPADAQDFNDKVSIYSTHSWAKESDVMTISEVEISSVAFSPDGTRLAVGAEDGTAGVWSLADRQQIASYDGATAAVTAMSFAPDGRSVLSASNDGVARVWRALGSEQALIASQATGVQAALTSDQLILVGVVRGATTLEFLDLPSGQIVSTWKLGRAVQAPVLSPDGRFLAALPNGPQSPPPSPTSQPPGPPSGPVRVWSVAKRKLVSVVNAEAVSGIAFSQDDSRLVLLEGGVENSPITPTLVDLATGRTVQGLGGLDCTQSNSSDYALSRSDRVFAAAGFCGQVDIWNAATGVLLRSLNQGAEISAVDLTPDGSRLLVASWDSRATIYDVATGRPLVNLIGHTRGISWAGFAQSGSLVVTVSLDHTVRVWNARTGQQLRMLTFSDDQSPPVVFSPDGQLMAIAENTPVAGAENVVRVFGTCPACQNPKALLALAAPHAAPASRLTALERSVIDGS